MGTKLKIKVVLDTNVIISILSYPLLAKADFIISGDKHLLTLGKFQNTLIFSPKKFLDLFK